MPSWWRFSHPESGWMASGTEITSARGPATKRPPCITPAIRSCFINTPIVLKGLPSTKRRSACFPTSIVPMCSDSRSNRAAAEVLVMIAFIGVMPRDHALQLLRVIPMMIKRRTGIGAQRDRHATSHGRAEALLVLLHHILRFGAGAVRNTAAGRAGGCCCKCGQGRHHVDPLSAHHSGRLVVH